MNGFVPWQHEPDEPSRRRIILGLLAGAAGGLALTIALTLIIGLEALLLAPVLGGLGAAVGYALAATAGGPWPS